MAQDKKPVQNSTNEYPRGIRFLWLLLPASVTTLSRSLQPIDPFDYWWYLALGRRIDVTGKIPSSNLYLFSLPPETDYINLPWLAELLMYQVWELGGHSLLKIVENLNVFTVAILLVICSWDLTRDVALSSLSVLFSLMVAHPALELRSRAFVLIFFIGFVWALLKAIKSDSGKIIWISVPLTAIWMNLHGSFLIIPGLSGLAVIGYIFEQAQHGRDFDLQFISHGMGSALSCFGVIFFHPHSGLAILEKYLYPLIVSSDLTARVGEWEPIWATSLHLQILVYISFAVAIVLGSISRLHWAKRLLLAATALLQIFALRMIFWWIACFALICPPMISRLAPAELPRILRKRRYTLGVGFITGLCLLTTLSLQPPNPFQTQTLKALGQQNFATSGPGKGVLRRDTPIGLARRATQRDDARIFHHQSVSDLLHFYREIRRSQSSRITFLNQRFSMIPFELLRQYWYISDGKPGWELLVDGWGINTMLLSVPHQAQLVQQLSSQPDWRAVGIFHQYILFEHTRKPRLYPPESLRLERGIPSRKFSSAR
jgi:hypothetical protein